LRRVSKAGFLAVLASLLGAAEAPSTQVGPPGRTVWDEVYFHAQADRGEVNFYMHCLGCHDGSGDGLLLSSEEFFDRWREEKLSALFTYMKATMPPDRPGSLSDDEYLDLLIYILQLNQFPSGETDLLRPQLGGVRLVGVDGHKPLPAGTPVYFLGCLSQTENGWTLTSATAPSRSRTLPETEQAFKTLETQPLGSDTVRLEGSFEAVGNHGAKVYAKGSLTYRNGESGIDVSAIRVLSPQCKS
jgi:hypothetical protein